MKTTSITSFIVASAFLVVYFLLCGGELSAGIVLLGWILITRKAQSGRWASAKPRIMVLPISRVRTKRISQGDLDRGSMRHGYQTPRRLAE